MFKLGPRCVAGCVVVLAIMVVSIMDSKDVPHSYLWFFVFFGVVVMATLFGAWLDKDAELDKEAERRKK